MSGPGDVGSGGGSGDSLARLAAVIESRKPERGGDPEASYVARLFAKGDDAILKKIGEEATEVVLAAKDGRRDRIVAEMADLWFHSMIALARHGLAPADVIAELERREGLSGLEEFALRKARAREAGQAEPAGAAEAAGAAGAPASPADAVNPRAAGASKAG